jgi:hypothetical protein
MLTWDEERHQCSCCLNRKFPTLSGYSIDRVCSFCFLHCRWGDGICAVPKELRDFDSKLRDARIHQLMEPMMEVRNGSLD